MLLYIRKFAKTFSGATKHQDYNRIFLTRIIKKTLERENFKGDMNRIERKNFNVRQPGLGKFPSVQRAYSKINIDDGDKLDAKTREIKMNR